jgi:hypothetical protein
LLVIALAHWLGSNANQLLVCMSGNLATVVSLWRWWICRLNPSS